MLNAGDKSLGFAAQSMGGPKRVDVECTTVTRSGTTVFTAPRTGRYKFVAWGCGGAGRTSNGASGGSGSYGEVTRALGAGQSVTIVLGQPLSSLSAPADTTLTFPDGSAYTAGSGQPDGGSNTGGVAGAASGPWDYSLPGTAGAPGGGTAPAGGNGQGTGGGAGCAGNGVNAGGPGGPARLPHHGGSNLPQGSSDPGTGPAFGGVSSTTSNITGGPPQVIIQYLGA